MKKAAKHILVSKKWDIVRCMTEGSLTRILAELGSNLAREDLQQIECDCQNHGVIAATETLIDCLKTLDDSAFTRFLFSLRNCKQTQGLHAVLEEQCKHAGLQDLLPGTTASRHITRGLSWLIL